MSSFAFHAERSPLSIQPSAEVSNKLRWAIFKSFPESIYRETRVCQVDLMPRTRQADIKQPLRFALTLWCPCREWRDSTLIHSHHHNYVELKPFTTMKGH